MKAVAIVGAAGLASLIASTPDTSRTWLQWGGPNRNFVTGPAGTWLRRGRRTARPASAASAR